MAMKAKALSTSAIIAIAVTGLFLTLLTTGLLTSSQTVSSIGTVTALNVGVYSDSACTQNCTSIDWGTLAPGNSTTKTVYIKNTGSVPATLSMATTNWVPSNANTYLTLTWNRANYVLNAGTSVSATLTLTASSSAGAITTFSVSIVITGTN
jgi:hypothetical protein